MTQFHVWLGLVGPQNAQQRLAININLNMHIAGVELHGLKVGGYETLLYERASLLCEKV